MSAYLLFSGVLMILAGVLTYVMHNDCYTEESTSRKIALFAVTAWAWPLWVLFGVLYLVRYALEPYMNKEDQD